MVTQRRGAARSGNKTRQRQQADDVELSDATNEWMKAVRRKARIIPNSETFVNPRSRWSKLESEV